MFITKYCKENKVAIFVQNKEQFEALLEVFEYDNTAMVSFHKKGAASFTIERRTLPSGHPGIRTFMYTTVPEDWQDEFIMLTFEEFVELADESKPIVSIPKIHFNG